jgi:hypothetical protein
MRGFLLGIVFATVIGGTGFYLSSRHGTLNPCTAAERGLTAAVAGAVQGDIQGGVGTGAIRSLADMVVKPLTEPLIRERVRAYLGDRSWPGCAWTLVRLDLLDHDGVIEEMRSLTVRF